MYTAYYDRKASNNTGLFTIQHAVNGVATKDFERVAARSGSYRYRNSSWIRGKSPIPYGVHWLATRSVPLNIRPGERFFAIGSKPGNIAILQHPTNVHQHRMYIGLHWDTPPPGSAGCIAITSRHRFKQILAFLETLPDPFIQLVVL